MFLRPLSPPARLLVAFGLTAPCLLITVACLVTFKDQERLDLAFGWVRHTLQVENRIHRLVLELHEVDSAQRSYVYTGRSAYLDAYNAATARMASATAAARQDMAADPLQQQRFTEAEAMISDRLDLAQQIVEQQKNGHHDVAARLARADRGKQAMETLEALAEEMRAHEENLLTRRDLAVIGLRRTHARWLYALLVLNISSLACTLVLLRRLDKAHSLARVCAWSKRIEHEGQWLSFEDYLRRRFDIKTTHTISPSEVDRLMTEILAEPGQPAAKC